MPPVQMTRSQYQQTYGTAPSVSPPIQPTQAVNQTPVQMTRAQYQTTYGQTPPEKLGKVIPDTAVQAVEAPFNLIKNIVSNAVSGVKQIGTGFGQLGESVSQDIQGKSSNENSALAGRGALNATGGAFNTLFSPVAGALQTGMEVLNPLKKAFTGETFGETYQNNVEGLTNALNKNPVVSDFLKRNPNSGEVVQNIISTVLGITGLSKAPEIKGAINTGTENLMNTIKEPFKSSTLNPDELKTQLQGVAEDWKKPTTVNEAKYNNARAVLEKDPNVTQTLANQGLNPFSHIEDGKYATADTADKLRADTGKLSRDALRPALQIADYSTPKTLISEFNPKTDTSFGITADDRISVKNAVKNKLEALKTEYPDGMSLENMLDEKINYDKNAGWKDYKPKADNIDAVANTALADNLRILLDKKTPPEIPIQDFQAELSKNYRAASYLDALNGKIAPVSLAQTVARYAAKFGGAKLGAVFGGDVVSSFAGYQIGKVLERFAENLTNPMRDAFLKNLKITNPEAFTAVEKFMSESALKSSQSLKLPPGKPLGTSENPIIPPAPTTFEKSANQSKTTTINPKTKDQYVRDLKTGKKEIINP